MKKQIKRTLVRALISMVMLTILYFLSQLTDPTVAIFYWSVIAFMLVNFWLHLKKERRDNYNHFFLSLLIMAALAVMSLVALIGWVIQSPAFGGNWAKIFGWHGAVAMIIIASYALLLFDKSCRDDIAIWWQRKIGLNSQTKKLEV